MVKLYDIPHASAPVPAAPIAPQQQPQLVAEEAPPQLDTRQSGNEIVVKKTVIKKKYVPEVGFHFILFCFISLT